METVWVKKGDDQILIERKQLSVYKKRGFERCDPPASAPVAVEDGPPATNLVTLYKGGEECQCEKSQLSAMEAAGWSADEAAKEGVTPDGGNEHEGRTLDQEHGSGGHVEELHDDSGRVEQQPSKRGNRTNRRKRRDDEDS